MSSTYFSHSSDFKVNRVNNYPLSVNDFGELKKKKKTTTSLETVKYQQLGLILTDFCYIGCLPYVKDEWCLWIQLRIIKVCEQNQSKIIQIIKTQITFYCLKLINLYLTYIFCIIFKKKTKKNCLDLRLLKLSMNPMFMTIIIKHATLKVIFHGYCDHKLNQSFRMLYISSSSRAELRLRQSLASYINIQVVNASGRNKHTSELVIQLGFKH